MATETLAELIRRDARIVWWCDVGNPLGHVRSHDGLVDLDAMAAAKGYGYTLANRRPRCPATNCPGRVSFSDRTSIFARSLDTISDCAPAWWAYNERRRQELTGLGWRMERGYWKPPADWPEIGTRRRTASDSTSSDRRVRVSG